MLALIQTVSDHWFFCPNLQKKFVFDESENSPKPNPFGNNKIKYILEEMHALSQLVLKGNEQCLFHFQDTLLTQINPNIELYDIIHSIYFENIINILSKWIICGNVKSNVKIKHN